MMESGLAGNSARSGQRAVFLSYASEDASAAQRICAALQAAGIEVWFDQSELRGGDAWDAAIRKQIKSCALFIPIISSATHARIEGYFRLEWKLAVDRSHLLAPDQPFLVPVAIDGTPQADERLPDRFREVQWTRLPDGQTTPEFVERIARLLAREVPERPAPARAPLTPLPLAAAPASRTGSGARLKWAFAAIVAAVLVGAGGLALRMMHASQRSTGPAPPVAAPGNSGGSAIPEKSIAVLPFVDMSEKKDQEYFSDGLAEELLDLLAQVPDLRVPARTSSFYFKGRSEDIATIASKLRVAHVLEGSVRKAGGTMRVTAQLIRADNGYHLWSHTYDRDVQDVFRVQDEIANSVVEALKTQLLAVRQISNSLPTPQLASRHQTANIDAYSQYLLGNTYRERDTPASNQSALAAYKKAAALDPAYAAAYSGIADAEWRIADQSSSEPAAYQRALAAADRAIELAPDASDGYWARGGLRMTYFLDWPSAAADFKRALEIDPKDVRVLIDYGLLEAGLGRMADAKAMLRQAVALDPLSIRAWRVRGLFLAEGAELKEARAATARIAEITTDSKGPILLVAELDLREGRFNEALRGFESLGTSYSLSRIAMAQYSLGHDNESRRALDQVIRQASRTLAFQIAEAYAWRGERDQAFEWLERAYEQHDGGITYLPFDPLLANVRDDPRFHDLLRKLKLAT